MKTKLLISVTGILLVSFLLLGIWVHDKNVSDKQLSLIDSYQQQMHFGSEYWQHSSSQWQSYPEEIQRKFLARNIVNSIFEMFDQKWQQCGTLMLFNKRQNQIGYQKMVKEKLPIWALMLSKT
ncbi:hypothetical protein A9R01_05760 ['Osedax' symbiont bacterium Rs2_46_30_T18]|nr:hypothetical protein A9R01_05760 ['Osedax' symbiont bacterium Rs2_46_30_T18]